MAKIHPTAVVSPEAVLGEDVSVGAYSIIKGPVTIGAGTVIHEQTNVQGKTFIGQGCQIGPVSFVGLPPQHLNADPDAGELIIGDHVTIRETATVHRSIQSGADHATRIGSNCFLMGSVHVAHDCVLGDSVIMANAALLGGHCHIADRAFLGGGCTLNQYVRVGRLAIIAGNEALTHEVPPFAAVRYGGLKGYNAIGCQRAGMTRQAVQAIRAAYRCLHNHRLTAAAVQEIRDTVSLVPEVQELIDFIASASRGIVPSVGGRRRVFDTDSDATNGESNHGHPPQLDGTHKDRSSRPPEQRSAGFPSTSERTVAPRN
jgi:UDP-N-acetylglucosamine acyltransferase